MAHLVILRQTSLSTENYTKDGVMKNVHVVLKDKPFVADVGITGKNMDLKSLVLEANLYYDTPEKEVNFINAKPFEYTAKLNTEGTAFTLEFFLKILSSQNENALIKIRIRGLNSATKKFVSGLEIDTQPIQVISKPSVLRKKQERERQKLAVNQPVQVKREICASDNTPPTTPSLSVKRTKEDMIFDTLSLLQQQQASQQKVLEKLLAEQRASCEPRHEICYHGSPVSGDLEFENAFRAFVQSYNALPTDERPYKIRKVLKEYDRNNLSGLIDTMWSENWNFKGAETLGLKKEQEEEFCQELFASDIQNLPQRIRLLAAEDSAGYYQ